MLSTPLRIPNAAGRLQVLKRRAKDQIDMGEALTLDTIVNSIDAELIATGPSAKGPNRGAIVRHGRYVLWGFEGPVSQMTDAGRALFVNTVHFTAKCGSLPILEKRLSGTRDQIYEGIQFIKTLCPEYLQTLKRYLPGDLADASLPDVEKWFAENRPYIQVGKWGFAMFPVDEFAKRLRLPNYSKAYLVRCIWSLENGRDVDESTQALRRYTGLDYSKPAEWRAWYDANKDYLYFADCENSRWKVDEEAKRKRIPSATLRKWSSEKLDYRYVPAASSQQPER